jgi:hypothetical protein
MFIPDPDFDPSRILVSGSRIPDPKPATKERGNNFFVIIKPFFVATNFTKFEIFLFLYSEEKNLVQFSKIIELFTQKIVTKLSKIWVWDPGSGKNLFRIPDPGVKKAPDPGSGSATLSALVWHTGSGSALR